MSSRKRVPPQADFGRALQQLRAARGLVQEDMLLAPREVGRAKLPSTVLGLLMHAAEHTMRHTGQLLVTIAVLKNIHQQS